MSQSEHQIQLVCDSCGAVGDGAEVSTAVSALTEQAESAFGFQARAVQVTAFGQCAHCRTVSSRPG